MRRKFFSIFFLSRATLEHFQIVFVDFASKSIHAQCIEIDKNSMIKKHFFPLLSFVYVCFYPTQKNRLHLPIFTHKPNANAEKAYTGDTEVKEKKNLSVSYYRSTFRILLWCSNRHHHTICVFKSINSHKKPPCACAQREKRPYKNAAHFVCLFPRRWTVLFFSSKNWSPFIGLLLCSVRKCSPQFCIYALKKCANGSMHACVCLCKRVIFTLYQTKTNQTTKSFSEFAMLNILITANIDATANRTKNQKD